MAKRSMDKGRLLEIARLRLEGRSFREVAQAVGVSLERARQLVVLLHAIIGNGPCRDCNQAAYHPKAIRCTRHDQQHKTDYHLRYAKINRERIDAAYPGSHFHVWFGPQLPVRTGFKRAPVSFDNRIEAYQYADAVYPDHRTFTRRCKDENCDIRA